MKLKKEFIKEWSIVHSKGIIRYITKDLVYYFLILVVSFLLGIPILILTRHFIFHESVTIACDTIWANVKMQKLNLMLTVIIIAFIVESINVLKWYINEKKYKKMLDQNNKDEGKSSIGRKSF